MGLSYTIMQTYGRTRRSAILASENNSKQLTSYTRDKLVRPVRPICEQLCLYFVNYAVCFGAMFVWVMFLLINITIIAIHLAYPYAASDKFFSTEPDKGAESFLQLTEATTLRIGMKMNFITSFSDGRNKYRNRLEVEHCWPDDTNGVPNAQQNAERTTQKRQQKQRYMDYNLRGLKPKYSQLKAQDQLIEYQNAAWNDFPTHNIQKDVMLQVSSNFLHDVEQIKAELTTLSQEMRNLRVEFQEHRLNAMEGNSRPWAPTQKGKQKTVRFCNYCHKNGHTPNWCRKKMRDEEIRKLQNEKSSKNIHVPNQNHGSNVVDRSAQYDQNVDRCLNSDDGNNPTNELPLTTEHEAWQDESDEFTPLEPKFFHRNNSMNFNAAQFTSADEPEVELSDPLPLGY